MNDTVAAAWLSGLEAGRFQGYQDGRADGYRDGYAAGQIDGGIIAWRAAEADERRRFAIVTPPGDSFPELQRRRQYGPAKPVPTPAECLATWSTP